MAFDVITYNKSKDTRYEELTDVLELDDIPLGAAEIKNKWCNLMEVDLESVGWTAVWKICRHTCGKLGLPFPSIVLVMVEGICFKTLTALVKVEAVLDDSHLPETIIAPLVALYPMKNQQNAMNIEQTSNCLDQLRFFYNHMWMPWDCHDEGWNLTKFLHRFGLYYDMLNGVITPKVGNRIRSLIEEGKEIQLKIESLEKEVNDDSDEGLDSSNDSATYPLIQLHSRLEFIKNEYQVLENPEMRILIMRNSELNGDKETFETTKEVHIVWLGGTVDALVSQLMLAKKFVSSEMCVKCVPSLQEGLNKSVCNSTLLLGPGKHNFHSLGGLEDGGSIKGLAQAAETMISCNPGNVLMDCTGPVMTLENITLDTRHVNIGLLLRHGTLYLRNCRVEGGGNGTITQGVVMLPGTRLVADNCEFVAMGMALVVDPGAEVMLTSCTVHLCKFAFQVFDNSMMTLDNCSITNCMNTGFRLETSQLENSCYGNLSLLDSYCKKIKHSNLKMEKNEKGEVLVIPKIANIENNEDIGCCSVEHEPGFEPPLDV